MAVNEGVRRLSLVLGLVGAVVAGGGYGIGWYFDHRGSVLVLFICAMAGYLSLWGPVRAVAWIVRGFRVGERGGDRDGSMAAQPTPAAPRPASGANAAFEAVTREVPVNQHTGSTVAIAFGFLALVAGWMKLESSMLVAGPVMILGGMAYRSAKNRWLGEVEETAGRIAAELLAVVSILALVLLQNGIKQRAVENPFPNVIIPLWVIVAYLVVAFRRPQETMP